MPRPTRCALPSPGHVTLAAENPTRETALAILAFAKEHLAPYKRLRRVEFTTELPKTISGKIRRVELRGREQELPQDAGEYARRTSRNCVPSCGATPALPVDSRNW